MSYAPTPSISKIFRPCPLHLEDVQHLADDLAVYIFDEEKCHLSVTVPQSSSILYWPIDEQAAQALRVWVEENLNVSHS